MDWGKSVLSKMIKQQDDKETTRGISLGLTHSLGKMQILASGKEEIEALKAQVSALEKQLKEMLEKDSKSMETMAVDKDEIEQLKARVVVLDRELERAALVSEHELVCWKLYVKIMQYLRRIRLW